MTVGPTVMPDEAGLHAVLGQGVLEVAARVLDRLAVDGLGAGRGSSSLAGGSFQADGRRAGPRSISSCDPVPVASASTSGTVGRGCSSVRSTSWS